MEEGRPPEAAGHRPALEFEAGRQARRYYVNVKIYSSGLALGMVGAGVAAGVATLGALYLAKPEATKAAVKSLFTIFAAEVLGFKGGSILVELCFHTKESFLAFMDAFEAKTVKQRLQEELSKIGFKGELEVTIVNDKEVYDTLNMIREEMEKRSSDFETASDSSGVESMESEEELSQLSYPGEPLTPPMSDLEELRKGSTPAYPKWREEMEKRSSDFDAASDSSGFESMESDEEFSPQHSQGEPLTPPMSDLEVEELPEVTAASAKARRKRMKAAAASPLVKDGVPLADELEELAYTMGDGWRLLGHCLGIQQSVLKEIDRGNEEPSEKVYHMLMLWKQKSGFDATYKVLYDALVDKRVWRRDLAEKFCFNE